MAEYASQVYTMEAVEARTVQQEKMGLFDREYDLEAQLTQEQIAKLRLLVECAYRRGFFQGWAFSLEAIQQGFSKEKVHKFLYDKLSAWRYCRHGGKMSPPPQIN